MFVFLYHTDATLCELQVQKYEKNIKCPNGELFREEVFFAENNKKVCCNR